MAAFRTVRNGWGQMFRGRVGRSGKTPSVLVGIGSFFALLEAGRAVMTAMLASFGRNCLSVVDCWGAGVVALVDKG